MARKALCEIPAHHPEARETVMRIKSDVESLEVFPKDILRDEYNPPCSGGINVEE